ncbi:MAG TPA: Arc family DNA-binding protein [Pseudolabrys sp.]|nr:Arc family DNA-binding protein [Pseudolabrys sp.]
MARGDAQFNLRFSDQTRDRIAAAARASGRSMNAEIIFRLEASFSPSNSIEPKIAALLDQHIQQEVEARIKRIAAKLGGA